ncbi:vacuolar transporter chaperone [Trypanosoma theileri]|uniref:Vacuolar transporter chaperone n=1 Tax=Trypanosoma theileri TaxID=67003 RepID=A0A1X0NNJ4_9TRYP|nr:vacuolar transporter chaperone [Trypanosoma theileri]ORC86274.1 vacuolar transporter chaperone [Trypanosoma theileri]
MICCVTGSAKPWADGEADGDAVYEDLQGPGGRNLTGSVNDKRICVPQKIDPKTFFANERTFLKWLSISVMVGMMSLTLLNFGDTSSNAAELAGLVLLPVSIIFMVYSLFVFRDRANKIYMREPMRYDDTRGPTVLVLVLGASLVIATIFSIQRHYYRTATPSFNNEARFS